MGARPPCRIEDFHHIEGRDSQLRNLTIEQYREEKARIVG